MEDQRRKQEENLASVMGIGVTCPQTGAPCNQTPQCALTSNKVNCVAWIEEQRAIGRERAAKGIHPDGHKRS